MALYLLYTDKGIFQVFNDTATGAKKDIQAVLGLGVKFTAASVKVSSRVEFSNLAGIIIPKEGIPMGCARLTGENVAARQAQLSFVQFVFPDAARGVSISYAAFTIPDVVSIDRIAQMSWAEFSIPDRTKAIQMSWAQLSLPDAPLTGTTRRPTYIPGNDTANEAALKSAISAALPGDTILLPEASEWVGNFKLPQKVTTTQYITIRTDIPVAQYPAVGTRIPRSFFPRLARLKGRYNAQIDVITTAVASNPPVCYWKLKCLEIANPDLTAGTGVSYACVSLGANDTTQTTLDVVPHHLMIEHCWIHGDPYLGVHRCIYLNCGFFDCHDSVLDGAKTVQSDGQVIAGVNGTGPFYITNCELGGGTETFIYGGDATKIPLMFPTDFQFRKCWIHNYLSLRNAPAVADMGNITAALTSGTLPAGTYTFSVSGRGPAAGTNVAFGLKSNDVSVTLAAPGGVTLSWTPLNPTNTVSYRVWRSNSDGTFQYYSVGVGASTFTLNTNTAGTAGSTPTTKSTKWAIKNLFELKNGTNVVVDGCLLETMWVAAQDGAAFTIKLADYRSCTECKTQSQNITLSNCVCRHMPEPIVLVGAEGPGTLLNDDTRVLTDVTFSNILFYDSNDTYGGFLYAATIGPSVRTPRAGINGLTFDHCTFIHYGTSSGGTLYPGGNGLAKFYDWKSATGYDTLGPNPFVFTNNMCMRGQYGFFGSNVVEGEDCLSKYAPIRTVARNVIAGAAASKYPANNEYPTQAEFEAAFKIWMLNGRDANDVGNYSLKSTSRWATAFLGTDNKPIGVDIAAIKAAFSPDDLAKIANLTP